MRTVLWLVLIFAAAVIAATTLGSNDGLVTVFFGGWRTDVSLNLFVLGLLAAWFALNVAVRGIETLLSLPRRAGQWRAQRRERAAQRALREAQFEYAAGRYSRALKAAESVLAQTDRDGDEAAACQVRLAAQMQVVQALHRLQDLPRRDDTLSRALDDARAHRERSAGEALQMLAAEHALDDRQPDRALQLLQALPPGVGRRTHALRLRLRAARLANRPAEALHTARMLDKHQGLSEPAAQGLLRSLCVQVLDTAHDLEQLRCAWDALEPADRADPTVAAHAARKAVGFGGPEQACLWLEPVWAGLWPATPAASAPAAEHRSEVVLALCEAVSGMGPQWLALVEPVTRGRSTEPTLNLLAGLLFAERGLLGKARAPLEFAARSDALTPRWRRRACRALVQAAQQEGDEARAAQGQRELAALD